MQRPESIAILRRVGVRVRARRDALGITGRALAERSGLSLRFISQLESGQANIAIGRLAQVARALGVSVASLVEVGNVEPSAVALLGLRGAGKTTLGAQLATRLGIDFVELDDRIEKAAGLDLAQIFALHGEGWYRRLEADCLGVLLEDGRPAVVALSGGVVQNERAWELARRHCTTAWLRAAPEDHMARVLAQGDRRPVADRANAMDELRAILSARESEYRRAEVVVDTSEEDELGAVECLVVALSELGWTGA